MNVARMVTTGTGPSAASIAFDQIEKRVWGQPAARNQFPFTSTRDPCSRLTKGKSPPLSCVDSYRSVPIWRGDALHTPQREGADISKDQRCFAERVLHRPSPSCWACLSGAASTPSQ